MIKNFIFDFGGVILDIDMQNAFDAFAKLGYPSDELKSDSPIQKLMSDYQMGFVSTTEFCESVAIKCNAGTTAQQVADAWNTICINIPDYKLEALKQLRKHHKVYLLSNTNDLHWDFCCDNWFCVNGKHFNDYFDRIFLSQNMGLEKPNPEIFKTVISELRIEPNESIFLDDNLDNVKSAASCGLQTYHVAANCDWVKEFVK